MSEHDGSELMTVQAAIDILDKVEIIPRTMRIPLDEALGFRLAENVSADRDYPPFEKSLMDGYAVRWVDVAGGPAELHVIDEIPAGSWPDKVVGAGECAAIMTGAPMPAGADGVVPVEDVEARVPVGGKIRILRAASPSRYVARRGSDCVSGSTVLSKGMKIGPAQIAVAASVGASSLLCSSRVNVSVLSTGDELIPVQQTPDRSNIRDSNSPMLAALLRKLGCHVADIAHVRDDPDLIREAIVRGMVHDALFVTGGMSMGQYDYVPRILQELGVDLRITKLRIKPGKPFLFGVGKRERSDSNPCFVFGLPGNPVSAYVCTLRLASRVLARLAGNEPQERWLSGRLDADVGPNGPREFYQPVVRGVNTARHSLDVEVATVTPLTWKGSADLFTLASANALLVRAENEPALAAGTVVRVLELP